MSEKYEQCFDDFCKVEDQIIDCAAYDIFKSGYDAGYNRFLGIERQYTERLGRLAELCATVIPWLQGAMSGVNDSDIPIEVKSGITEIMDYVEAVRPEVYCQACSEAGGAERPIYHGTPACKDEKAEAAKRISRCYPH